MVNSVSRLLALAQLVRLPNVFTAFADILMMGCVVGAYGGHLGTLALLLAASGCLYLSGMAWNDFFDRHADAQTRPARPLPSGRIRPRTAALIGTGLMLAGVGCATAAGWPNPTVGVVAAVLAGLILLYDGVLKHYWLGPVAMAGCRVANVGMVVAAMPTDGEMEWVPRVVAAVIFWYILGVTWCARSEEGQSRRGVLIAAAAMMAVGVLIAAALPVLLTEWQPLEYPAGHAPFYYLYLLAGFGLLVGWPVAVAIRTPTAKNVQRAVKRCILGLALLDAVLACLFVGWPGLLIALLLVPALLLGRWVYST